MFDQKDTEAWSRMLVSTLRSSGQFSDEGTVALVECRAMFANLRRYRDDALLGEQAPRQMEAYRHVKALPGATAEGVVPDHFPVTAGSARTRDENGRWAPRAQKKTVSPSAITKNQRASKKKNKSDVDEMTLSEIAHALEDALSATKGVSPFFGGKAAPADKREPKFPTAEEYMRDYACAPDFAVVDCAAAWGVNADNSDWHAADTTSDMGGIGTRSGKTTAGLTIVSPSALTIEDDATIDEDDIPQFAFDENGNLCAFMLAGLIWSSADGYVWTSQRNGRQYRIKGHVSLESDGTLQFENRVPVRTSPFENEHEITIEDLTSPHAARRIQWATTTPTVYAAPTRATEPAPTPTAAQFTPAPAPAQFTPTMPASEYSPATAFACASYAQLGETQPIPPLPYRGDEQVNSGRQVPSPPPAMPNPPHLESMSADQTVSVELLKPMPPGEIMSDEEAVSMEKILFEAREKNSRSYQRRRLKTLDEYIKPKRPGVKHRMQVVWETFHARTSVAAIGTICGAKSIHLIPHLETLARITQEARLLDAAQVYHWRALTLREHHYGEKHPSRAGNLEGLAKIYYERSHYSEAAALFDEAINLRLRNLIATQNVPIAKGGRRAADRACEAELLGVLAAINDLAQMYAEQEDYMRADQHFKRAVEIWNNLPMSATASLCALMHTILRNYKAVLFSCDKIDEARALDAQTYWLRRFANRRLKRSKKESPLAYEY